MHISIIINQLYKGANRPVSLTAAIALCVFFFSVSCPKTEAQMGQTMYFMDKLPQSSLLNPAYQHAHNFHLGLPGISSININARTNFASFSDIIFKHPQYDSLITMMHPAANIEDFTSKLKERNFIAPDLHVNLFSFGFRANKSFISFNISERASFRASLPKDFLLLGLQGNEQFVGKKADFSNIGVDMNYYREYALGYSYVIDEKLTVGARGKLLFGKANVSFANTDIGIYTDNDTYAMNLHSKFTVNLSMPITMDIEDGEINDVTVHFDDDDYDPLDFVLNSKNAGFAIDLGATYRLIEPVTLYASISDLGFISWKQDAYNISMDGSYEFTGLDLTSLFDSSDDSEPGDNLLDELEESFKGNATEKSYVRGLPTRIYLGGTYELHRALSFGLLSRSEIYHSNIEQALTLSANTNLGRRLSASVSYSMMNNSYNNFGAGLSLRGLMFQFYVLSDNLNTIVMPHKINSVNLWFGFNMMFGHKYPRRARGNNS